MTVSMFRSISHYAKSTASYHLHQLRGSKSYLYKGFKGASRKEAHLSLKKDIQKISFALAIIHSFWEKSPTRVP